MVLIQEHIIHWAEGATMASLFGIIILLISALHINYSELSCFLMEPYVVGTQMNRLSETVLLSTQNKGLS